MLGVAAGQAKKATQDTTQSYVDAAADRAGGCLLHNCRYIKILPRLQLAHALLHLVGVTNLESKTTLQKAQEAVQATAAVAVEKASQAYQCVVPVLLTFCASCMCFKLCTVLQ